METTVSAAYNPTFVHIIYPDELQYAPQFFNAFFTFFYLLIHGSLRRCGSWSPADTDNVRASSRGGALGLMMAALPKRDREYSQTRGPEECVRPRVGKYVYMQVSVFVSLFVCESVCTISVAILAQSVLTYRTFP